jgi:hypothetical protein
VFHKNCFKVWTYQYGITITDGPKNPLVNLFAMTTPLNLKCWIEILIQIAFFLSFLCLHVSKVHISHFSIWKWKWKLPFNVRAKNTALFQIKTQNPQIHLKVYWVHCILRHCHYKYTTTFHIFVYRVFHNEWYKSFCLFLRLKHAAKFYWQLDIKTKTCN